MASCIGVIGAENQPLLIKVASVEDDPLKYHYMLHTSLDYIEERIANVDVRDQYLGLLYPTEDARVYAYCTNTHVKFIIVVDAASSAFREQEIRTILRRIHAAYANIIQNPFYQLGDSIKSSAFNKFLETFLKTELPAQQQQQQQISRPTSGAIITNNIDTSSAS